MRKRDVYDDIVDLIGMGLIVAVVLLLQQCVMPHFK